jgi:nucleotide-binding universal stress UspA family protein
LTKTKNLRKADNTKKLKKTSKHKPRKQRTIKKILVPLDGSKNSVKALDMAISLSSHYSASITAVYIFDLPASLEYAALDPVGQNLKKKIHQIMNLAKLRATRNHVPFKQIVKHGKIGPDIINIAKKGKFDIIVIGKRGISSIGELFLGSISHYVVHHSKIPVIIVK